MAPHHKTWPVAGLLFGSGFCALAYQIGWLREFRLVFGASTAASAAVLAIFIGGLGLGGWLLGPRADRHRRPLAFYAQLEAIVALSAAASPLLLALVRGLYATLGGTPRLGLTLGTIVRLMLSALVLAVPTLAMGGTLPAAARAVTGQGDERRRQTAALYACNTLGAVAGCLVATFFALELFGTRQTLWLAASVNLLVAVGARQLDRGVPSPSDAETSHAAAVQAAAPAVFVLVASGVVGFAFFLMELVWYRMLGPLVGGSVFSFGLILAVALAGIGAGGLVYALVGADRPASTSGFATICLVEAGAVALAFALGDRLATLAVVLTPLNLVGFPAQVAAWVAVTAIAVLPTAIAAGYQFPMLVALLGRGREALGRQIGLAYVANTVGAIAGSLAGGFGLLPWLTAPGAWRFVSICLVALGVAAAALRARRIRARVLAPQLALAAATMALLTSTGPTAAWRHSPIGAGRAPLSTFATPNDWRSWMRTRRRVIAWDGDGTETSVALATDSAGYAFIVNGKADGSAIGDAGTQVMLGVLGPILNPTARRALVIGLGTGSSAGWIGAVPSIERVDVVELEPLVLEVAGACTPVNRDVLHNPRVHITIGDARELLLLTPDRYDVIASEPSNPFRAGVASLFTREYYRAASDRLTADGVFLQWLQAYEVDARTLRTVYATMAAVFAHIETWQTSSGDLVLVGTKHPIGYQAAALIARIQEEPFRTALRVAWRADTLTGFLAHYVAGDALARAVAALPNVEINEDDRNVVEFGFARSVGRVGKPLVLEIRDLAGTMGDAQPRFPDAGPLDASALRTGLVSFYAATGFGASILPQGSSQERARQSALVEYYARNNLDAARDAWRQQTEGPRDPVELAMVADFEASAGSDLALSFIQRVRAYEPAEADTLLATLRLRQSKTEDAAAALESALGQLPADPWPLQHLKERAISLAGTIGAQNPVLARRMIAALSRPFAAGALEEPRLTMSALLSQTAGLAASCLEPVAALEPHTPWNRAFLTLRRECYEAVGDPRVKLAWRELADFAALEPSSFAPRYSSD